MKLPPPVRPPERLREAAALFEAGRLEEALVLLEAAQPDRLSGEAALLAARCALDKPDPVAALRLAGRAATAPGQVATRVAAWRILGRLHTGFGQERLAAEAYRGLLALRPADPEARLLLGRALIDHGWPDLAGAVLATLEQPLPGWWRQVLGWAAKGLATARREARALLARRAAPQPGDAGALVRRLIRLGRLAGAEAALRQVEPGPEAIWLRAWLAERRAWPEPAAIPDLDLDAPPALCLEIAGWLMRRGEAARAAAMLEAMPEAARDDAAWLLRARLMILSGDVEQLAGLTAAALRDAPHNGLLARLRLTALALSGPLAPLGPATLPQHPPPGDLPLVQYWDKEDPPPDVAEVMESWPAQHAGLRLLRFHRATARAYLAEHHGEQGAAAFDACPHPAVEADLLRYAVLAREGGLWADADDRCRASWLPLMAMLPPRGLFVSFSDELPYYAYNAPLLARPGNPILVRALDFAMRALLRQKPGARLAVWAATGPGLLTRLIAADPTGVRLIGGALLRRLMGGENGLAYKFDRAQDWRPD